MGCCLGTTKTPNPPPPHHPNGPNNRHFHARSSVPSTYPTTHIEKTQLKPSTPPPLPPPPPPPPPPVIEEESVKEVLSETPISKPQIPKITPDQNTPVPPKELSQEPSQASEPYGVSESFSYSTTTTTTTIADSRDDEATSKRKREVGPRLNGSSSSTTVRCKRPYSGDLAGRRERGPRPSLRALEPEMGKRNRAETRSSRGRESGRMRPVQRGGAPTGVRRDTVSSRSRSPATRTAGGVERAGIGKSTSKVTGRAGGSSSQASQLGALETESEGKTKTKKEEGPDGGVSQQGNESLENPLVSLECFIFV